MTFVEEGENLGSENLSSLALLAKLYPTSKSAAVLYHKVMDSTMDKR